MYKNKMLGCIPNFLGVLPGIDVLLRTIKKKDVIDNRHGMPNIIGVNIFFPS